MEAQDNDFKSVCPPKIRLVTWVSLFSNYYNLTGVDGKNMWCNECICCNSLESSKIISDLERNLWEKFIMKWQRSSRNMDYALFYFAIMSRKVAPYWRQIPLQDNNTTKVFYKMPQPSSKLKINLINDTAQKSDQKLQLTPSVSGTIKCVTFLSSLLWHLPP